MRKNIIIPIAVLIFTIALTNVNNAHADVAPPEPPTGTNPLPGDELTNVRMVAETVLIDIGRDGPYGEGRAKVTADFTMRNLGTADEQMEVRFPLDQTTGWGTLCTDPFSQFEPITDLKVKVNGRSIASQKTYQTITITPVDQPAFTITLPCWEHFPVLFPPGKDVTIQVTYTTEPYHDPEAAYNYAYVLETGTGWKDTIGSADIIFQVPYELNNDNFYGCWPDECTVDGGRVQWHFEDFEPENNPFVSLLPPQAWQAMAVEKANVAKDPNDGEAWGRLAKAYKTAAMTFSGFRDPEMYRLSQEAYRQAVTLRPNDADWHYGYAELLCWNAEWSNFLVESEEEAWRACVEAIRQTLDLNPKHEDAKILLQYLADLGKVDISGPQPDYLVLTPKPTQRPANTIVPANTSVPAAADLPGQPTKTIEPVQVTQPVPIAATRQVIPTAVDERARPSESSRRPLYLVAAALIAALLVGIVRRKK